MSQSDRHLWRVGVIYGKNVNKSEPDDHVFVVAESAQEAAMIIDNRARADISDSSPLEEIRKRDGMPFPISVKLESWIVHVGD